MLLGATDRDRLLEAAYDEPSGDYVARDSLYSIPLRPFSLGVFRRALRLDIEAVKRGFNAIAGDREQIVADCERLAWLLSWDQAAVRGALCRGGEVVEQAVAAYTAHLMPGQLALVRREVERNLGLIRAAMFGVIRRAPLSDAIEKAESEERAAEPLDLLTPPRLASIALTVHRETGWSEAFVQEDLPLCRLLQYAHAVQWVNPQVWTVEPAGPSMTGEGDLFDKLDEMREQRGDVEIDF